MRDINKNDVVVLLDSGGYTGIKEGDIGIINDVSWPDAFIDTIEGDLLFLAKEFKKIGRL